MKNRPILFSAPMVRAILDGRKTQTRRNVKNATRNSEASRPYWPGGFKQGKFVESEDCPYGIPGDQLWVKETWKTASNLDDYAPSDIPECFQSRFDVRYLADGDTDLSGKTRVSIFMPRWASRIRLEITDVRVERLQDISQSDAKEEGVIESPACFYRKERFEKPWPMPTEAYRDLWESINGPGSWDANPWVWAITFRRTA